MANSNFKVRHGLDVGDSVRITDAGVVTGLTELTLDNININGNTISSTNTDGNITLAPNGTGDVLLTADTVQVGDSNTNATITTNGTGDLILNTNAGTNSGSITIADGVNGAITVATNGTGNIALNTNDGSNVVTNKNFVDGAIRNANTQARGNIWELLATTPPTTPTQQFTGVSVDNAGLESTKLGGMILRNYGSGAGQRPRLIFERSRGTAASPSPLLSGDFLGEVDVTGYATTGWINDSVAAVPAFYGFNTTEAWTSTANCGTQLTIALQPTATQLAAGSQTLCLILSPQANSMRGDTFTLTQGKTTGFTATGCSISGTTLTIGSVTTGTVTTGQFIQNAGQTIGSTIHIVSGSGSTWTLSAAPGDQSGQTIAGRQGFINANATSTTIINDLQLFTNNIKGSGGTTQIVTSSAGATLELRGDNIQLENAAGSALTSAGVSYTRTYGEFAYTAATITIAAQNTVYAFPLDTTLTASGTSISNTSRVNINVSGYYKIIMSLQCAMETNSVGQFDFWLRKNNVDVANSATQVDLLKDQKAVISMDWLVESDGNDYWEIMYASNSANYANLDFPFIPAWTTPTNPYARPAAPVILVNVIPAGM